MGANDYHGVVINPPIILSRAETFGRYLEIIKPGANFGKFLRNNKILRAKRDENFWGILAVYTGEMLHKEVQKRFKI